MCGISSAPPAGTDPIKDFLHPGHVASIPSDKEHTHVTCSFSHMDPGQSLGLCFVPFRRHPEDDINKGKRSHPSFQYLLAWRCCGPGGVAGGD